MADLLKLTDVQKVSLSVAFVTAKGNPAPVEGVPVWAASDSNVLDVQPSTDGFSVVVLAKGPLGPSQVSVTADADLGEGVVPVVGLLDVDVVASQAVAATISAGAPEPQ